MDTIRLGILQVHHDKSVSIGERFPDDAHRFRDLFDRLSQRFRYRVYMTIGGELPGSVDEQDAFLITGSPLSVRDGPGFLPELFEFIRACDAARKPLVGVCFGHQAIAAALGGAVGKSATGWNVGVERTVFNSTRPWMDPVEDIDLFVFHEDQVTAAPEGCDILGASAVNPCACLARGHHLFTTQSHPEFDARFMRALLTEERGLIGDAVHARASEELDRETRGDIFAAWCARFFRGDSADPET